MGRHILLGCKAKTTQTFHICACRYHLFSTVALHYLPLVGTLVNGGRNIAHIILLQETHMVQYNDNICS